MLGEGTSGQTAEVQQQMSFKTSHLSDLRAWFCQGQLCWPSLRPAMRVPARQPAPSSAHTQGSVGLATASLMRLAAACLSRHHRCRAHPSQNLSDCSNPSRPQLARVGADTHTEGGC